MEMDQQSSAYRDSSDERPIALVTGANKGIGYEIAAQLARLGMTVLIGSRDRKRGEEAAAALRVAGGNVRCVVLDVTDMATIRTAVEDISEQCHRLDVLVNNAGVTGPRGLCTADLDVVRAVFETNVFGVVAVTNAMLPLLRRSSAGRIVNLSSSVGSLARTSDLTSPFAAVPPSAYGPSKTALNALTIQYAKELRSFGILVNAADPGGAATDMTRSLGYQMSRSAARAASVAVRLAVLGADGPTGEFFDDQGRVPW
jgi:NAD(P)-dependent dehydrogenase (short-subunit alcohol dehydrogenase family)